MAYENLIDGAGAYIFHADLEGVNFRKSFTESGFKLSQVCIWAKNTLVMGRNDYHWKHEPCLYGWKPTGSHRWFSDRKQTTVWEFDRPTRNAEHPTMKPVPLIQYCIENSSQVGELVLETFGGSGTTMIASDTGYRYRLWFTSADGKKWVPINTSTSTNATATRDLNTRPIDPFGDIVYRSTNGTVNVDESLGTGSIWQQYTLTIGYSYVKTLTVN